MTDKIVIFGSIVQDLISYTPRFPRPGESVRGTSFHAGSGGKGANQAVAAARLGANVCMIGKVGDDVFADSNINGMRDSGVDVSGIDKSKTSSTATATITVNEEGENSIVVTLGANMEMTAEAAEQHASDLDGAALLLLQAEVPQDGNRRISEIAKEKGVTVFFNPAPGDPNLDKSILKLTDIVCANENEAEFLTDIPQKSVEDAKTAAKRLLEMGPSHAVITLGSQGCITASKGGDIVHIPTRRVTAVDTTGAGDCFCGSMAYFLVVGEVLKENGAKMSFAEAVRRASSIASLSVLRKGTQSSYSTRDEIEKEHPELLSGL